MIPHVNHGAQLKSSCILSVKQLKVQLCSVCTEQMLLIEMSDCHD